MFCEYINRDHIVCAGFCMDFRYFVPYPAQMILLRPTNRFVSLIPLTLLTLALAAMIAVLVWAGSEALLRRESRAAMTAEATRIARHQLSLLDSELARYRLLPIVLAEYGELARLLGRRAGTRAEHRGGGPGPVDAQSGAEIGTGRVSEADYLNQQLRFLAGETGAPILYLLDQRGIVVAASNAQSTDSFISGDFGFRPYFNEAMANGQAEYHGAGMLSGRPGLFIARRIANPDLPDARALGVVVVKYEFDRLLAQWRNDPGQTVIADSAGVVLAATDPALTLHTLADPTSDQRARILASGQFPAAALPAGPLRQRGENFHDMRFGARIAATLPITGTGLRLIHLFDPLPALRQADQQARLWTLAVLALLGAILALFRWRASRKILASCRLHDERMRLEAAVEARTGELRHEMAERARSDAAYRQAREDLAHANRLAALGQITAGLVHEINQPVATIRTLAENARHHLGAGRLERVAANLDAAVELTARIGSITQQMRQSAQRGQGAQVAVSLAEAMRGAQLILGDRLQKSAVTLDLQRADLSLIVLAERVALEQVLVNLLQNAMESLANIPAETAGRRIALISCIASRGNGLPGEDGDLVELLIADNGPGIADTLHDRLFSPFASAKPQGLGLGLAISRDLMRRMQGELLTAPSPLGGAGFVMRMKRA
jgi:two-component system C4-dicarboxylate transport sensor histidine kinase DctB